MITVIVLENGCALQINVFSSSAFIFASIEAFKCGNAARYLEISLKPVVYPSHLGKSPVPKNQAL